MPFRTRQAAFRGRNDTVALNTNTFDFALNASWTESVGDVVRVRFLVQEYGGVAGTITGTLYYSLNGAGYAAVTASTPIRFALSAYCAETDRPSSLLGGTGTYAQGYFRETTTAIPSVSLATSGNTEYEFSLTIDAASVANGDTIALQMRNGTSTLTNYAQTPTLTVQKIQNLSRSDAGTVASSGVLVTVKTIQKTFTGTVAPGGAVARVAGKNYAGAVAHVGALATALAKTFAGSFLSGGGASDTGALGHGADLSADFTTNIAGETRTAPWNIGAF